MLPMFKQKAAAGVAVTYRKPDENQEVAPEASALEACAMEMMEAIESKDAKRFAMAFQAAFECLASAPSEAID